MLEDKVAFVSKVTSDGSGTNKETYLTYSGFWFGGQRSAAIRINIQPASPELTALSEGEIFKTFKAFTSASGLAEGMRVTVSGTNDTYTVKGRENYGYGIGMHNEVVLIKEGR
jgi:hypothetical protein